MSTEAPTGVTDSIPAALDAATTAASKTAHNVASAVHVAASSMHVFDLGTLSYPNEEGEPWPRRHRDNKDDAADERKSGPQPPYTVFREWSSKSFPTPRYKRKWYLMLRTAGKPTLVKCATLILLGFLLVLGMLVYVLLEPAKREAAGETSQPRTTSYIPFDQEDTTEGFWLTEQLPERSNSSQVTTVTTTTVTEEADSVTTDESGRATTYDESDNNAGAEDTTRQQQEPLDTTNLTVASMVNDFAAATTTSSAVTTSPPNSVMEDAGSAITDGNGSATAYNGSGGKLDSNR